MTNAETNQPSARQQYEDFYEAWRAAGRPHSEEWAARWDGMAAILDAEAARIRATNGRLGERARDSLARVYTDRAVDARLTARELRVRAVAAARAADGTVRAADGTVRT